MQQCPTCQSTEAMVVLWRDATNPAYDRFKCRQCGDIFARPQLYPELYPEYQGRKWRDGKLLFRSAGSSQ